MKAVIMILTWVNGQSIATSQIEFTSMTSCEAAHSAITHEAQMMHNYLYGVAEHRVQFSRLRPSSASTSR
jgi:hypothetical protein